jgi:hypothetical protein
LGFAVAIHTDPDLLLVDEVLAVGDIAFQRKCLNSIFQFRNRGGTLLLVSHDIGTIQSICSRAIWLEDGKIQAEGDCTNVIMAYQQHVTAKENAKNRQRMEESVAQQSATSFDHGSVGRWGDGELRITRVQLCSSGDEEKSNFFTGDELHIHLHYRCEQRIARPVFGLAIHSQSGVNVYGPNTKVGEMEIPYVEGEGTVIYSIPKLPLLEGGYTVSVAAVNYEDTRTFDYHDRAYPFQVYPGRHSREYGLVALDGEWHWEQQTTPLRDEPESVGAWQA